MKQYQSIVITGFLILLTVSCKRPSSADLTQPEKTPKGTIHIERVQEAEAAFSELDQRSWVFKHRGGELTTEFTIYHRPEGKDQTSRVIFRELGDDTVSFQHEQSDDKDPHDQSGGYLIVALPDSFKDVGNVIYSFSLNGATLSKRAPAKKVFPDTVLSNQGVSSSGGSSLKELVELSPGETKVLVDYRKYLNIGSDAARDEVEMVRIVIKVTGLVDGQLPKRDAPRTNR